ncbi:MAG TPA: metalloregulator ArsR/SmtB family transcription factor [Pseudodesulfovibrio sp.]|nr:metalloregulator ArsR/SmtB family transcription factor [Pseudodesulfovibrio sp.]
MSDALSLTFSALADPTRRAMLARLSEGPATVTELAEPFKISLPAISRHLKVLEHAGLIERKRAAQWRPAQLKAEPLKDAVQWLETYRENWEANLDRLDEYLRTIQDQTATSQDNPSTEGEPQ